MFLEKLRISRVIPWKCLSFLDISRAQNPSKITKNNSQGIIFVIISCQRVRFRGVRFQTTNSVSFFGLTEFRGANSVSSSRPIICVQKRTHRVFRRTHWVCPKTQAQWVLFSETVLSKQYSARFLISLLACLSMTCAAGFSKIVVGED